MNITDDIIKRSNGLLVRQKEVTPGGETYEMFNTGSIEAEIGELLYALVRATKATRILETGTHFGVSSAYMAQAMHDNVVAGHKPGHIKTFEVMPEYVLHSRKLWGQLGLSSYLTCLQVSSLQYLPGPDEYDFLFLDSEPNLRFAEFTRFWSSLRAGGFLAIHDLHSHLGHTGHTVAGQYDWPYGDFRPKLGPIIKAHDIQTITLPSPRGFTLFQKIGVDFGANRLLKGEI